MPEAIPTRVQRAALDLATELQFDRSCSPDAGRLLIVRTGP